MRLTRKIAAVWVSAVLNEYATFKGVLSHEVRLPERIQQHFIDLFPDNLRVDWWKHTSDTTLISASGKLGSPFRSSALPRSDISALNSFESSHE
jgi:hypothetical protein